jgi:hypothetical protein
MPQFASPTMTPPLPAAALLPSNDAEAADLPALLPLLLPVQPLLPQPEGGALPPAAAAAHAPQAAVEGEEGGVYLTIATLRVLPCPGCPLGATLVLPGHSIGETRDSPRGSHVRQHHTK